MAFCLKFNQEAFSKSEEQRTANRAVQELESVGKHPKLLRQTILEYEKQWVRKEKQFYRSQVIQPLDVRQERREIAVYWVPKLYSVDPEL